MDVKYSITVIAAVEKNNGIGNKGAIPWPKLTDDLKNFRHCTYNKRNPHAVIMGRKTYQSLPKKYRPLPDRVNIVVSTTLLSNEKYYVVRSMKEIIPLIEKLLQDNKINNKIYAMGGNSIYEWAMGNDKCKNLILTRIHHSWDCDVKMPSIPEYFSLSYMTCHEQNNIIYDIEYYIR